MNKLAILRSKTNILLMHWLLLEVFRSFAYTVNPLKAAITNITNITINAMTNEKQFKVRSPIGQFRDIADIFSGRCSSRIKSWSIKTLSETKAESMFQSHRQFRIQPTTVLNIP
jgi:hypothetical protein